MPATNTSACLSHEALTECAAHVAARIAELDAKITFRDAVTTRAGLSTEACDWVLSTKDDSPYDSERVRRRCAHLMAGGSIESYVETT